MKFIVFTFTLFTLLLSSQSYALCNAVNKSQLSADQTERLYQLQDAVDDCEGLTTLVPLINELIIQQKFKQAQNYIDIADEYAHNEIDKAALVELNADYYFAQNNVCQVHKLISQKTDTEAVKQAHKRIDLSLSAYISQHGVNRKSLSCMFTASRSISTHRGLRRSKSINMAIGFKSNSAELTDIGLKQVLELSQSIKKLKLKQFKVNFVGHTDVRGKESYNLTLSKKRAQSVYQSIIKQEPNLRDVLTYSGKGEAEPKLRENSNKAHKINRRVEVYLSKE